MKLPIYLDHHATTPVDFRVLDAMLPYFTDVYGNAASIDHEYGNKALVAVERSRGKIASAIKASPEEIIFTSGATEADNLAILGVANYYSNKGNHIITCVTEHKAVLDACKYLEKNGWLVTYLPVDKWGLIDPENVKRAINSQTVLISVMTANNEIGVIAPFEEIGRIAHEAGVVFHTDATQAIGSINIDVNKMGIDLLSISGHKIYGPKGIGALFVRSRNPRIRLDEQIHGGGHERGMRSGTLNVPGIVGLATALEICRFEMKDEVTRMSKLRDHLWEKLQTELGDVKLNGHPTERLAHNLSISIPDVESRSLLVQIKNHVAISTGSACTTASVEPSHVIFALGFGEERAHSSLRFGLGRSNTVDEIDYAVTRIADAVCKVRKLR